MPERTQQYLIEGADFLEYLEPELKRLLSEIWNRKRDPLRPCWVVIPAAPLARHLKKVLLDAGVPLLNVEFLTLTTLRDRLAAEHDLPKSLAREKQELLLRVMLTDAGKNPEASGILLDAIDAMRDAGHPAGSAFETEGNSFRKLVEGFEALIGRQSVQHLDRELLKRVSAAVPCDRDCVLYGFDAGDWPGASVLLAAARSAARSAVFIRNAGGQVESLELGWMAWWREHYGEAKLPACEGANHSVRVDTLGQLIDRMFVPMREARAGVSAEKPLGNTEDSVIFLRHKSALLEARDAAALAALWASEPKKRVGLIFAGATAMSRLAVAHLEEWAVPFEDQLGSPSIDPPENAVLRVWFQMQQEGPHGELVEALAQNISPLADKSTFCTMLTQDIPKLAKMLSEARSMTMSDDVRVMARSTPENSILFWFAKQWDSISWPEEATPVEMAGVVSKMLSNLFGQKAYELESGLLGCLEGLDGLLDGRSLSRGEWVRYLSQALEPAARIRRGEGYSPIVVTSLERVRGQCFDSVLFCGLNEGFFPAALREMPFGLDDRSRELDATVSRIDDENIRRFKPNSGPILNFTARRGLERQRFSDAVGNARSRVCFSGFIWDDLRAHAETEPSEFFDWAWWASQGFQAAAARAAQTRVIEESTRRWSSKVEQWIADREKPADCAGMVAAVRRRFDPAAPCGEHQFVFSSPAKWARHLGQETLAVSAAERLLKDPVAFWFEKILKVSPRQAEAAIEVVPMRRGILLHELVRTAMQEGGRTDAGLPKGMRYPIEGAAKIRIDSLDAKISQIQSAVAGWFGRLPLWWMVELAELKRTALGVLELFSRDESPDDPFASEWTLDGPFAGIPWAAKLDHVGRKGKDWTVTDLKTGGGSSAMKLKPARLNAEGVGFQLVIYAQILAARLGLDPARIMLRYHHPRLRGGEQTVQAPLTELIQAADPILAYLRCVWERGCVGQRSDDRAERPLAHLVIPDEILSVKWNQTEGLKTWPWASLSDDEEEEGDEADE